MANPDQHPTLAQLVAELEEDAALALVEARLNAGADPLAIINECNEGMREVGMRYEKGEYFVAGLIMSGEIFRQAVERVQPLLAIQQDGEYHGRVMVGTVSGDIHDIGKNMFGMLLTCHSFDVIDLGVDVPPAVFAEKALALKPDIIGLSCLITASFETMRATVAALRQIMEEHGFSIPIIIGGGMIDDQIAAYVGADHWVPDAMSGVRLCERLLAGEGKAKAVPSPYPCNP